MGVSRSRQTSMSLMVRSSTPLAQSMTIKAESTAVSGPRHLNGAAEQQELLGQGGLARIGVGNDGKSPPFADFLG